MATNEKECNSLDLLYERGQQNGIKGLKRLSSDELYEHEPHAAGVSALFCPETGIIDYQKVCEQLSNNIQKKGEIITEGAVLNIENNADSIIVSTETMDYKTSFLINCAGLFSDKVAELLDTKRKVRIIPFRGEYYMLNKQASHLVKNLIYPFRTPLSFLGGAFHPYFRWT